MNLRKYIITIVFSLTILGFNCTTKKGVDSNPGLIDTTTAKYGLDKLEDAQHKWASKSTQNYQFKFQWMCECDLKYVSPAWITVKNDTIRSIYRQWLYCIAESTVVETLAESQFYQYKTIDGLFDFLKTELAKNPYAYSIDYNEELGGYPSKAYIDYDKIMADEEMTFNIFEVKIH